MKALTIQEPWAWAIVDLAGRKNPAAKIVENRRETFPRYTGPLLIHSGKGTLYRDHWQQVCDEIEAIAGVRPPAFGEIAGRGLIGVCRVVACCDVACLQNACFQHRIKHCHAEPWASGPRCLLLSGAVEFAHPVASRGFQGLFEVPDLLVAQSLRDVCDPAEYGVIRH